MTEEFLSPEPDSADVIPPDSAEPGEYEAANREPTASTEEI